MVSPSLLSLSVPFLCHPLSVSLFISVSLFYSLSLSPSVPVVSFLLLLSLSLSLSPFHCLPSTIPLSLSLSLTLSFSLPLSYSPSIVPLILFLSALSYSRFLCCCEVNVKCHTRYSKRVVINSPEFPCAASQPAGQPGSGHPTVHCLLASSLLLTATDLISLPPNFFFACLLLSHTQSSSLSLFVSLSHRLQPCNTAGSHFCHQLASPATPQGTI